MRLGELGQVSIIGLIANSCPFWNLGGISIVREELRREPSFSFDAPMKTMLANAEGKQNIDIEQIRG